MTSRNLLSARPISPRSPDQSAAALDEKGEFTDKGLMYRAVPTSTDKFHRLMKTRTDFRFSFAIASCRRGCRPGHGSPTSHLQASEDSANRSRGQQRFSMRISLIKRISKLQNQSFGVLAMPLCRFAILRALVKVRRHYLDSPCKYRGFEIFHGGKSLLSVISGVFPSLLCQDHLPLHRPGQSLKRSVGAR